MISNGPSRTFTQEAVEAWFGRLCSTEWESFFSAEQLKNAQKYYREGYLSTIDVQEKQAIITKKINREETYSVIEWNGKTGLKSAHLSKRRIRELPWQLQAV